MLLPFSLNACSKRTAAGSICRAMIFGPPLAGVKLLHLAGIYKLSRSAPQVRNPDKSNRGIEKQHFMSLRDALETMKSSQFLQGLGAGFQPLRTFRKRSYSCRNTYLVSIRNSGSQIRCSCGKICTVGKKKFPWFPSRIERVQNITIRINYNFKTTPGWYHYCSFFARLTRPDEYILLRRS